MEEHLWGKGHGKESEDVKKGCGKGAQARVGERCRGVAKGRGKALFIGTRVCSRACDR